MSMDTKSPYQKRKMDPTLAEFLWASGSSIASGLYLYIAAMLDRVQESLILLVAVVLPIAILIGRARRKRGLSPQDE